MSELAAAVKRMRWRCRRGMRELDVLLVAWLDRHERTLSDSEQQLFERLLDESDMDLYAWFTRRGRPPDPALAALIERILDLTSTVTAPPA